MFSIQKQQIQKMKQSLFKKVKCFKINIAAIAMLLPKRIRLKV